MIEVNNLEIKVDELMDKIREEVTRRQKTVQSTSLTSSIKTLRETISLGNIKALLSNAESRSYVRTNLPEKYNRFPLNISKNLQKLVLKVFEIIFRDQRKVNFSLIQAVREFLPINQELIEQIATLQAHFSATDNRINAMNERLSTTDNRINAMDERLSAMNESLSAMNERYIRENSYLKNDLAQQKCLITLFIEEARQRLPEPFNQNQLQTIVNEEQHLLDAFYVAFEDQFRGSREEIIDRLKIYLPLIEEAKVGTQDSPILDVGCGRGEWLELLRESGYTARGMDINRIMVDQCRARGLEVVEEDVISYLKSLPDASLGVVTGFHVIEHLSFAVLMKLLNETVRVLKGGGLVIFETPNPQNVLVGSNNFYLDPTHRNPLPSPLVKFLLEHGGFYPVEIINLNSYEDSFRVSGAEIAPVFNNYFYGPQDYAVIGYKV
jgi:O-antigen chain-terminating methyltransferase